MTTAKEVLGLLEQQGQDVCVCPECNYEEEYGKGRPCDQRTCSECSGPLTSKGAPGEKKSPSDGGEEEGPADRYDAYGHKED